MQAQTAVVIGASGLIGSQVVQLLLNDSAFHEVRILVRRQLSIAHPKLITHIVSFDNYADLKEKIGSGHSIFCCVGTTLKKVKGDKELYKKVDYQIPVNCANAAFENGFKRYLLVSSVGAKKDSRNFYLNLKGSVEDAIAKLQFTSTHFFRPSLLLGDRNEFRLGERFAQGAMSMFAFMFQGSLARYKAIESGDVAKAMVNAAKSDRQGLHIYEYNEIRKLLH